MTTTAGNEEQDQVFTIPELATRWKVSIKQVRLYVARGSIVTFKLGERGARVKLAEVERIEREGLPPLKAVG